MIRNLFRQLFAGILIGTVIIAGIYFFTQPYAYQGSLIDPPLPAKDFSLVQADGTTFQLSDQEGELVLLYFGYTYCPDVCPTTLSDLAQAKKRLGDNDAANIQVVMITVDPERDTADHLQDYVMNFDPLFIGLSGDLEDLEAIWSNYGVYREKQINSGATGYLVDHTSRVYVLDTNGGLRLTFPFGMEAEAMADDLAQLLSGK
ncbi:MAG: redoxin domain-containing protein [Anaerolineae bacterium]|jgi:protein SCO1/2|nr:redoxin domain-containing protein [Anaerolineae bacterium]MBT3714009.1 redoxin domain-containing protein [Anaerolineae bacterium]MBT4311051.1 redoxin domain-containing protein [Anaerolineae bacterium]MBT4459893.1 redoxin domain-containing protein [Anaerolineae bacterium]MBT4841786.1 redoxin domain-containing protein [Anaerolineae bacterium]